MSSKMTEWRRVHPEQAKAQRVKEVDTFKEKIINDPKFAEKVREYQRNWARNHVTEETRLINTISRRKYRLTSQYKEQQRLRQICFKKRLREKQIVEAGREPSNCCELCKEVATIVFDHDHLTGKFRGWLCDRCNRTLGSVKDSPSLLRAMAIYLEKC